MFHRFLYYLAGCYCAGILGIGGILIALILLSEWLRWNHSLQRVIFWCGGTYWAIVLGLACVVVAVYLFGGAVEWTIHE